MSQSRDFGPQAADMRAALERYRKEELVELMLFIMKTYVLGSAVSPDIEVGPIHPPAALERMSFPQLISHLQMALKLGELEHFRVSGPDVYVTIGEREFDLLGSTPDASAGAGGVAAEDQPAPRRSAARSAPQPQGGSQSSSSPFAEMAAQARSQQAARPAAASSGSAARPAAARPGAAAARPGAAASSAAHASGGGLELDLDIPGASFANEPDFEMDDAISQRIAERNPAPEPLVKGRREDAEFGGGRPRPTPQPSNTRLNMSPPPPPPPIAPQAAGDLTPEERARNRRNTSSPSAPPASNPNSPRPRPGHDDRPALKGDDKEVAPNSRFGDLELD